MSTKMKKEELLELVVGYKKSSAVMAAYEMGIFERLHGEPLSLSALAEQTGVNAAYLSVFLLYLSSIHLVEKQEETWKLTGEMEASYGQLCALDAVIRHEKNIFQKWMYPERLIEAMKSDAGKRQFDSIGFDAKETVLYNRTMYGSSLKLLAFRLCRKIRQYKNPVILEYGRSGDALLQALEKTGYGFCGYHMWDTLVAPENAGTGQPRFQVLEEGGAVKFDIIFLYNTIHYYSEELLGHRISMLEDILSEDGKIFIVDLFFQEDGAFLSSVLLDWLTHGGVYSLTKERLTQHWEKSGSLQLLDSDEIPEINTSILVMGKVYKE